MLNTVQLAKVVCDVLDMAGDLNTDSASKAATSAPSPICDSEFIQRDETHVREVNSTHDRPAIKHMKSGSYANAIKDEKTTELQYLEQQQAQKDAEEMARSATEIQANTHNQTSSTTVQVKREAAEEAGGEGSRRQEKKAKQAEL